MTAISKTITATEALAIVSAPGAEDLEHFPVAEITDAGRSALLAWISENAKKPESHRIAYWVAMAEEKATNALSNGTTPIIEMRGFDTVTGNPVTMRVEPDHMEWSVYSDAA